MELDASDIERLRAGDIGALENCYRAFGARVQRLCRRLLGRREDADDATQEVFVKVFERARQFDGEARFSTWLYRVAVNHCLARIERESRRQCEPLSEHEMPTGADPLRSVDERDAIERHLAELAPDQRVALLLREVEGLDYREMAAVLDVPVGTVMSRLHRARQRLLTLNGTVATANRATRSSPR